MSDKDQPSFSLPNIPDYGIRRRQTDDLMSSINASHEAIAKATRERLARETKIAEAASHALNAAAVAVDTLAEEISIFERQLSDHEEVALYIIGGPTGESFFPTILKALNPDKVLYGGSDESGRPFTVIQHVSQLNFAMTATVLEEGKQARRIGVLLDNDG